LIQKVELTTSDKGLRIIYDHRAQSSSNVDDRLKVRSFQSNLVSYCGLKAYATM